MCRRNSSLGSMIYVTMCSSQTLFPTWICDPLVSHTLSNYPNKLIETFGYNIERLLQLFIKIQQDPSSTQKALDCKKRNPTL